MESKVVGGWGITRASPGNLEQKLEPADGVVVDLSCLPIACRAANLYGDYDVRRVKLPEYRTSILPSNSVQHWPVTKYSAVERVSTRKTHLSMAPPLAALPTSETPRVLSIQSHTVRGYVGNKSAVFPLQLLGFEVDPINSVHFSNNTAFPTVRGQVLNGEQLWDLIEGLEANQLLYYTHLLTGYIGSLSFLEMILQVLEKLRSVNPDLIYVCDPVMGDDGKLYVKPELVPAYRDKVIPLASLLTPNQFEAELLTGLSIQTEADALKAIDIIHTAGPSQVVITSLDIDKKLLLLGSHLKCKGEAAVQFKITMEKIPAYFTGTGDLMSALLLGWSYKYPDDLAKAAEFAVASLQGVLKRTTDDCKAAGVTPHGQLLELRLIQSHEEITSPQVTLFAEPL